MAELFDLKVERADFNSFVSVSESRSWTMRNIAYLLLPIERLRWILLAEAQAYIEPLVAIRYIRLLDFLLKS